MAALRESQYTFVSRAFAIAVEEKCKSRRSLPKPSLPLTMRSFPMEYVLEGMVTGGTDLAHPASAHPTTTRILLEGPFVFSFSLPLSLFSTRVNQPAIVRGFASPAVPSSPDLPRTRRFANSAHADMTSG